MTKIWAHDAHCNTNHTAGPEACPPPREDDDRSVFESISTATLLKPGDRVLLTVSRRWSQQQLHDANEYVGKNWPDIEFVFATEVDDVVINLPRRLAVADESRTDCVKIAGWSGRGLVLAAGNAEVTPQQLLEFAKQAVEAFPDGVIRIEEYALRVTELTGDEKAQPYLRFGSG